MSTFTKEQLIEKLQHRISVASGFPESEKAQMDLELARIALASLEAEPAIHRWRRVTFEPYGPYPWHYGNFIGFSKPVDGIEDEYYYAAPPAPVSVPDGYRLQPISEYDAMCAAMLQGADRPQNEPQNIPENIPATQFKPVADLYGLTSPTGGETSFTFDAVEARDFIDGGWSCQEYVELGRFQEAVSGKSPVVPDGWVACSEQMPEDEQEVIVQNKMGYRYVSYFDEHSGLFFDMRGGNQMNCIEHIFVTHWMPLPAAPQQEVESQIRKGKTVAREEWELGARLTKHRFKP